MATMSLTDIVFTRTANSSNPNGRRAKRNAMLRGMSLLLGGYNFWQTRELSSRIGENEQALKHMIFAVRHLSTATANINSNLNKLKDVLLQAFREIDFALFQNSILNIGEHLLHISHQRIHQIERTIEGLHDGLTGRLSPKLIDPTTLEAAIDNLEQRAAAQHFDLITSSVADIFEMPTFLYCEAGMVDVITHVPTVFNPAKLDFYTIEPIPFVLLLEVAEDKGKSFVWTVDYGQKIIVTNTDWSVVYEIDEGQIKDCTLLGNTYYCHQIVQRKVTAANSCGLAIFRGQLQLVHQLCQIRLTKVTKVAVAINRYQTVLYSQKQELFIVSTSTNGAAVETQVLVVGRVMVNLPLTQDCTVSRRAHQWRSWCYFEEECKSRHIAVDLDLSKMLNKSMTALAKILTNTAIPELLPVDTLLTAVGKELEIAR